MKKIIKYLSASLLSALLLVVLFSQTSLAETRTATSIEQQVGRLATVLEDLLVQEKPSGATQTIASQGANNPTCLDNYTTWKKSNTYKNNAKWNVDFIPFNNPGTNMPGTVSRESFIDLNGDGLSDYLFTERSPFPSAAGTIMGGSCVYLNNSNGFDLVYRCYVTGDKSNPYHGDCAG